jgi:hypothetical protein
MNENPIPPPPQAGFAAYPRAGQFQVYGTSEKLTRLFRGYHGMSYTFLLMILSTILLFVGIGVSGTKGSEAIGIALLVLAVPSYVATFFLSVRSGGDIGFGNGWSPAMGGILGFLAPLVGIIMIGIIQYLALDEMKRYGIKTGTFSGVNKHAVRQKIDELIAIENPHKV